MDILLILAGAVIGIAIGAIFRGKRHFDEKSISTKAEKLTNDAQEESKKIVNYALKNAGEIKKQFEIDQKEFSDQLNRMEKVLEIKIASQQKRELKIEELKKAIQREEASVSEMRSQIGEMEKQVGEKLIRITGLTKETAKQNLLNDYENSFKEDAELRIAHSIEWAQECAIRDGRNILSEALYRFTSGTSVEHALAQIKVPRDEIKGRIVGRGGRNIAFFEELFGVDVIFNDEPNTIIVGCFNLVQREIARAGMERLIREKNINEEVIARIKPLAEQDVARVLKNEGENVLKILGLKNMPSEFAKLIGRLRFRTSYGQNVLRHSFEVGYLSRLISSEIGANDEISWLAGVFHDIGKAVDQEVTGSHDVLSKEILEQYGFSKEIVHAAWTHHNSAPQETVEAKLVQAADALSAGRPGARAESMERYLAKIKDLQETALSFPGVRKAFAIHAGREVRVLVDDSKITDAGTNELAENIAAKIQEKGGYPGKIKVMAIRTTKVTDYARQSSKRG